MNELFMYTFLDLKSIGRDGEPVGVAVTVASSIEEARYIAVEECYEWMPEDAEALRQELAGKLPVICSLPSAFLSRT